VCVGGGGGGGWAYSIVPNTSYLGKNGEISLFALTKLS